MNNIRRGRVQSWTQQILQILLNCVCWILNNPFFAHHIVPFFTLRCAETTVCEQLFKIQKCEFIHYRPKEAIINISWKKNPYFAALTMLMRERNHKGLSSEKHQQCSLITCICSMHPVSQHMDQSVTHVTFQLPLKAYMLLNFYCLFSLLRIHFSWCTK